jgi:hypothetical protein
MARNAPGVALVLAACAIGACASDPTPRVDRPPPKAEAAVVLPASALPRMTSDRSSVDADGLTNEVAHPDELRAVLEEAGFSNAEQRSFGGGTGAFSRVLARGIAFDDDDGAASYLEWFADNAGEEIITSERISPAGVPVEVIVFRHRPDGCCHNDVPVYLAAWQRGSSVLYLHVGGRRANTRAFAELIESYDRQV